jgi:hypothetical protein
VDVVVAVVTSLRVGLCPTDSVPVVVVVVVVVVVGSDLIDRNKNLPHELFTPLPSHLDLRGTFD